MSESHVRYLHIAKFVVSLTDSVEEAFNPLRSDTFFSIHSLEIVKATHSGPLFRALTRCRKQP